MLIATRLAAALSLAALIFGCPPEPAARTTSDALDDLPECPHDWENYFKQAMHGDSSWRMSTWTTSGSPSTFLISRELTNIPEFHDCQRLLRQSASTSWYERLGAIFARASLDSLTQRSEAANRAGARTATITRRGGRQASSEQANARLLAALRGRTPSRPARGSLERLAIAEVLSEKEYPELGLVLGFNCLVVSYGSDGMGAAMIGLGRSHIGFTCSDFDAATPPSSASIRMLNIRTIPFGKVPAVARWEWSRSRNVQLIGAKCLPDQWCVFGTGTLDPLVGGGAPTAPTGMQATGWYDEQYLAQPIASGSVTTVIPSRTYASVFPDDKLSTLTATKASAKWIAAAYVSLPDNFPSYTTKLGLTRTLAPTPISSAASLNKIELCYGSATVCGVPSVDVSASDASGCSKTFATTAMTTTEPVFWAKVTPPSSTGAPHEVRYHCVRQMKHPGINIPAVVRWRWKADDETIWIYCDAGCCELHKSPE